MTTTTAIGQALYIEAYKEVGANKNVLQMLLAPETTDSLGNKVKMTMYRRRISTLAPRKTWKSWRSPFDVSSVISAGLALPDAVDRILSFTDSTFSALVNPTADYKLAGPPILVDITQDDVKELAAGKTPYKIFGRVWRCRKKLGYPDEFL